MKPSPEEITGLLLAWGNGDKAALDRVIPLVYQELRRLAHRQMRRERAGDTLQTTALVNEAYLRLVDYERMQPRDRAHFLAIAAQAMRRILIERARSRRSAKRGSGGQQVSLDEAADVSDERAADVLALDEALTNLAAIDPRKSSNSRAEVFRRADHRRDRRGSRSIGSHGGARLAHGQDLAAPGNLKTEFRSQKSEARIEEKQKRVQPYILTPDF